MSPDLTTRYLGFELKNPLVVAACPLTGKLESLVELESAGAAAVVLPSLFAEQVEHDEMEMFRLQELTSDLGAESPSFLPELESYNLGPAPYLDFISRAKQKLAIPVIASLNGTTPGKWVQYAKQMETAGADALELNIYFVSTDQRTTGDEIETQYVEIVRAVAQQLAIPLSVKIGPYFSSLPNVARRLVDAGAAGLVLFNRYLDPELDLDSLQVAPHLELSGPHEVRLVLRWLGILRDQLDCSLAGTSGIHSAGEVVKAVLAGADATMLASALLINGPQHITTVLAELSRWLVEHEHGSIRQLVGSFSHQRCSDPSAFHRANYMKALTSYTGKGQ